jgi:hypothetical protein
MQAEDGMVLNELLGRDVIDAKRYLGYQFVGDGPDHAKPAVGIELAHTRSVDSLESVAA